MREGQVVQFVCFETILNREQFVAQWEQFTTSDTSNLDITLQQSEKKGLFKYIVQHRCKANEFEFTFVRARRHPRHIAAVPIKTEQAGGYSVLQSERKTEAASDESKIFAFVTDPRTDLGDYRKLTAHAKLNIYEAYYENCRYAYILEFFVKNQFAAELIEQLKKYEPAETGIYQEFVLEVS